MAKFGIGVVASCLRMAGPAEAAAAAERAGVECLQVSSDRPAGVSLDQWLAAWRAAAKGSAVRFASAVTGFPQEDYSTIAAIHRTGGLRPDDAAEANIARIAEALDFAAGLGVDLLTFHAGFIPENHSAPAFARMLDRIGRCADLAAGRGLRIGLESGQESAATLRAFLDALGRNNVGCNFDPANMILYGRQNPLDAVDLLAGRIFQVHAKDATWSDRPGETWDREVPLGRGDVDFAAFVAKVRAAGFVGDFIIEREGGANQLADIAAAATLLRSLR